MTLLDRIPILLRLDGPMTIAELTTASGYANPSVRRACRRLLRAGWIAIVEGREGAPGLVYGAVQPAKPKPQPKRPAPTRTDTVRLHTSRSPQAAVPPVDGPDGSGRPWGGVHVV